MRAQINAAAVRYCGRLHAARAGAERERYRVRLEALGRRYGRRGQSGAEMTWYVCQSEMPRRNHWDGFSDDILSANRATDRR